MLNILLIDWTRGGGPTVGRQGLRMNKMMTAFAAVAVAALSAPAAAADFSYTGNLSDPNQVLLFNFNVGSTSQVTLRTYSYAGGTNAAGTVIANGGFDPILALFVWLSY